MVEYFLYGGLYPEGHLKRSGMVSLTYVLGKLLLSVHVPYVYEVVLSWRSLSTILSERIKKKQDDIQCFRLSEYVNENILTFWNNKLSNIHTCFGTHVCCGAFPIGANIFKFQLP